MKTEINPNVVATPCEQLFYKIQNAFTPEILNGLAGEILDCKCTKDEAAELMWEYQRRAEYFAANARAAANNYHRWTHIEHR